MQDATKRWIIKGPRTLDRFDTFGGHQDLEGKEVVVLCFHCSGEGFPDEETAAAVHWALEDRGLSLVPVQGLLSNIAHFASEGPLRTWSVAKVACVVVGVADGEDSRDGKSGAQAGTHQRDP
jgi:hypothetical protein